MARKPQRIRDPVHNLVEFNAEQFEYTLWQVIQTRPFQRLRRIRQLGFSEFVFPGATHTRLAHSLGVFHTARKLMALIQKHIAVSGRHFGNHQAQVALAAALVHDVGHGMFSHAFESVGKRLSLPMARHEKVSEALIRQGEIAEAFGEEMGSGFANDVADLIARKEPGNLYDAVVSSQFDADRLDYMQRDRLMTGVQSSGIDITWLMANLEVASVKTGADDEGTGTVETLVLGPKAVQSAETYVLSLFHLYPNVYLHKTTRAAERVFVALMLSLFRLVQSGGVPQTGLPANHPIVKFGEEPDELERAVALDDSVFWGALPMMCESPDAQIAALARRLRDRQLPTCIDIRRHVEDVIPWSTGQTRDEYRARIKLACANIVSALQETLNGVPAGAEPLLIDLYDREPYKRYQDSNSPLNRILIRAGSSPVQDVAELSPIVASAEPFQVCRAYVFPEDTESRKAVENIIGTEMQRLRHGNS